MRRSSPLQSVLRNPTLVGAITVLVVILAVFLAYNANSGLPFVATYRLTAEVPNAASTVPGNEVRSAAFASASSRTSSRSPRTTAASRRGW